MPRHFLAIGAALAVILAASIEIAAFVVSPRSSAIAGAVIDGAGRALLASEKRE